MGRAFAAGVGSGGKREAEPFRHATASADQILESNCCSHRNVLSLPNQSCLTPKSQAQCAWRHAQPLELDLNRPSSKPGDKVGAGDHRAFTQSRPWAGKAPTRSSHEGRRNVGAPREPAFFAPPSIARVSPLPQSPTEWERLQRKHQGPSV